MLLMRAFPCLALSAIALQVGCAPGPRAPVGPVASTPPAVARPAARFGEPPRRELAVAFVRRDTTALRRMLATDLMVWPPPPDTAQRGSRAVGYLLGLVSASRLRYTEFQPHSVTAEGPYTVEDGMWVFRYGGRAISARYGLRWRRDEDRWRVSFLKWDRFR